jgi:chorismate-pyruvate lyase
MTSIAVNIADREVMSLELRQPTTHSEKPGAPMPKEEYIVTSNEVIDLKSPIQMLIRLAFEQPALLSGVFMTPLLEAHAGKPLQVHVFSQQLRWLEAAVPELKLEAGESVLERKVLLENGGSTIPYLYAEVLIVPGALPDPAYTRLLQGGEPIGRILQDLRLPTFREVIAHGRAYLGDFTDEMVAAQFDSSLHVEVAYRTLLLSVNQHSRGAAMRITEVIPLLYVYNWHDGCVHGAAGTDAEIHEEDYLEA